MMIFVSKQICSDSFKNKITHKLLTYKLYNHLTVRKQMSSGSFKNVICKLCVCKSYIISKKKKKKKKKEEEERLGCCNG